MPKKILPEKTKEFDSESSEGEEEEGDSGSETGSDHEQFQIKQNIQSLPNSAVKKVGIEPPSSTAVQSDSSSSGEDDESGSESESEGAEVALPAKRGRDPKKSGAAGGKRTHGEPETTMSKKKKLELSTKGEKKSVNDDTKKQLFQRIWSEDDEIVVLKGMVDYAEKKKSDPVLDLDDFHGFIKDNLHFDVSRNQLQEKIRRLKKKFLNHKTKEEEGIDQKNMKPHEQQAYELSKEVWGKKIVGILKPRSSVARKRQIKTQIKNGKSEDMNMVELVNDGSDTVVRTPEFASVDSMFPLSSQNTDMESLIRSIGTKLYEGDGIVQGTKEWHQLALEEIELYDKKLTLMSARAKLVIRGLKSRNQ